MKILLLSTLLILVSCFGTDKNQIKDAEMGADPAKIEQANTQDEAQADNGFMEENDECICTKEYNPVCGSNGVTYPSACQAGCEKITEFTEGSCSDEEESEEAEQE